MSEPFDPSQTPTPAVTQQANPYAAQTPSPYDAAPTANSYGGAGQAFPGSKAYVEQHFGPVAGFGSRVGALLIDVLVSLLGLIPVIIGAVLLVVAGPETDEMGYSIDGTGNGGLAAIGALSIFLGILLSWGIQLWNRVFRMGRTGQSVGKKAMGLKLIHVQTGQPIGAGMSFAREVVSGLLNQIFLINSLWMLWDSNKQTVADKVASSTVVRVPKS